MPTTDTITAQVIAAIKTIYDPEIPVNIYELGLIYDVTVDEAGHVDIQMTLTTPACPVAGILPLQVETKAKVVEGVTSAKCTLVWDPPWTPDRMSDAAKLTLNLDTGPKRQPGERPERDRFVDLRMPDRGPRDRS